jgi:hypothetical protein
MSSLVRLHLACAKERNRSPPRAATPHRLDRNFALPFKGISCSPARRHVSLGATAGFALPPRGGRWLALRLAEMSLAAAVA